jgi:D-3-phosphoglycerate dehydrogenase / 2-oxoglutarate reductase
LKNLELPYLPISLTCPTKPHMTLLIADTFEQSGLDGLRSLGCDVLYEPGLKDAALTAALQSTGAEILVVRSTQVTEAMLEAGHLSLIVRAGAGVNTIDVAAASRRGIYVSNCPGKNSVAVAELAFALILALDRRVPDNVADLRRGVWNKKEFSKAHGLFGRTLGLLGFGNIGQEVARRARAFGMPVIAWSRGLSSDAARGALARDAGIEIAATPEEVVARADVLSIHLALTRDTRAFVNASLLKHLKAGAIVINTARGEVVDYGALAAAVQEKSLRVGLDVFANEPSGAEGSISDPILSLPNVIGTHHIGASTDQAQEAISAETVRIVRTFLATGKVPNVVNLATKTPATHMLVVRHRDKPGVLAHVFERLRDATLNVQETENIIFDGAHAAIARINLDGEPPTETMNTIQSGNADILSLQVVKL